MQPVARREADLEQLPTGSPRTAIGRQLITDPEGSRPLILSVRLLLTPCTSKDTSEGDYLFLRLAGIFCSLPTPRVSAWRRLLVPPEADTACFAPIQPEWKFGAQSIASGVRLSGPFVRSCVA